MSCFSKLGFDEVSNTWNGGLLEVVGTRRLHGCPRKFVVAGRLCGETDATCGQPVSSIDSLALISTRSGTKLEKTSLSAGGLKCLFQKLVARI